MYNLIYIIRSGWKNHMSAQTLHFKRTKHACYFTYLAMSSVFSLPPILFVTFREMYGVSYTLLGTLVLVNFCTQLTIDLIFTFFSKHFNIQKTIRLMPLLTSAVCLFMRSRLCCSRSTLMRACWQERWSSP